MGNTAPNSYKTLPDEAGRFGIHGGRFVAETLMPLILEVEKAYASTKSDPGFETELLYCTTGVLLRKLNTNPLLDGVTHVVVDEVHERSHFSDFLLVILREILKTRKDLRVILMSATLERGLFQKYFNNCPSIEIEGRTFSVDHYL